MGSDGERYKKHKRLAGSLFEDPDVEAAALWMLFNLKLRFLQMAVLSWQYYPFWWGGMIFDSFFAEIRAHIWLKKKGFGITF